MPVIKVKLLDFYNRAIGIIKFQKRFQNFISDTMNWFLNSMSDCNVFATGLIGIKILRRLGLLSSKM